MKKATFLLLTLTFFISCKPTQERKTGYFTSVKMDTILKDKISIRPITVSADKVWYAADKNRVGYQSLLNASKMERILNKDSIKMEFRSIAQTTNAIFILNVGNPALLYKFSKDLTSKKLVYEEHNEKVFYDSMQFWDDKEGIAIGDPIDDCFAMLITRDGGDNWTKVSCDKLPKMNDGEAAFAASNTNIIIKGNDTWLVSGGKKSRVFYSPDKGISWKVYETPIVQGEAMTGIFTADFYNDKIGFIAGGNYEKPNQNFQNKALTTDGGKTWKLVGENTGFGYASCIQFVPESNGNELVCIGASGLYYSKDKGTTWSQLSSDNSFYTIRFIDRQTAIAAGKKKIVKIKFLSN
ncbi:oxidoreductase [Flavobacterium sp. SUN052]|uniref:sialidase family protein n=1 Tax=Flavobacterium sp. SUN052 TaxID=3002441 RepID=UPI00237EE58E|nr:oxidoreductase [Flavobacterium sp. SUN052]MEC4005658.1 oxidoreductase [Flavobacterium sp. SUN052]